MAALRAAPPKSFSSRVHVAQRPVLRAAAPVRVAPRRAAQTVAFFDFFKPKEEEEEAAPARGRVSTMPHLVVVEDIVHFIGLFSSRFNIRVTSFIMSCTFDLYKYRICIWLHYLS